MTNVAVPAAATSEAGTGKDAVVSVAPKNGPIGASAGPPGGVQTRKTLLKLAEAWKLEPFTVKVKSLLPAEIEVGLKLVTEGVRDWALKAVASKNHGKARQIASVRLINKVDLRGFEP